MTRISGLALALAAGTLVIAGQGESERPAGAETLRPIERLRSQPPLSSSLRSPALRSRDAATRQALESRIRRLEQEGRKGGTLSPTLRAQKPLEIGPGLSAERVDDVRRDLNRLKGLERD